MEDRKKVVLILKDKDGAEIVAQGVGAVYALFETIDKESGQFTVLSGNAGIANNYEVEELITSLLQATWQRNNSIVINAISAFQTRTLFRKPDETINN